MERSDFKILVLILAVIFASVFAHWATTLWVVLFHVRPALAYTSFPRRIQETKYIDQYFEIDKKGNKTVHIFLPGTNQKIAEVINDGEAQYILSDHLNSTSLIIDQDTVVRQQDYLPYGMINYQQGTINNHYTFNGKELDRQTGLQYFGGRYYNNEWGKFISVDQGVINMGFDLADPQTLNSYSYVTNNPLRYIDPTGATRQDYLAPSQLAQMAGDPGGTYKGVQLYAGDGSYWPQQSQCVTGVQNLYKQTMGVNIRYGLGAAKNYGDLSKISGGDIAYYSQGGTVIPQENDIITWENKDAGHVGMIIEVSFDAKSSRGTVYTVEQNHSLTQEVFAYDLSAGSDSAGQIHYYIKGFGSKDPYEVVSWQRPAAAVSNSVSTAAGQPRIQTGQERWYTKIWNSFKNFFSPKK